MKRRAPLIGLIVAMLAVALAAAGISSSTRAAFDAGTVVIELRVWQNLAHEESLWVSARPKDGRWDTLGTVPLPPPGWSNRTNAYGRAAHRFGDVVVGYTTLRVWQRVHEPDRIYVQLCGDCPERVSRVWLPWRPLGKIPLPLDDGRSANGRYRYGDIDIAVPFYNPGLLADREYLLALRDVLEGDGAELNWDAGTHTTRWEGVTVSGAPPRVTGLHLAHRGLTGEIWGWLGDLTKLTELRLNGNALTGMIPSKLHLLKNLRKVYLAGNDLEGCVPPRLWEVAHHDLDNLGLPECGMPEYPREKGHVTATRASTGRIVRASIYNYVVVDEAYPYVLDVPAWRSVRVDLWSPAPGNDPRSVLWAGRVGILVSIGDPGAVIDIRSDEAIWLFLRSDTADELERSHYQGCIYDCARVHPHWKSRTAWIEQIVASLWLNRAITYDWPAQVLHGDVEEWVWP